MATNTHEVKNNPLSLNIEGIKCDTNIVKMLIKHTLVVSVAMAIK